MTSLLLDTHIIIWYFNQDSQLPEGFLQQIQTADKIFASAISCFEMSWLYDYGRIALPYDYDTWFSKILQNSDLEFIDLTPSILHTCVKLPEHHKDPHDRMIIATSLLYNLPIITVDGKFEIYSEIKYLLIK